MTTEVNPNGDMTMTELLTMMRDMREQALLAAQHYAQGGAKGEAHREMGKHQMLCELETIIKMGKHR